MLLASLSQKLSSYSTSLADAKVSNFHFQLDTACYKIW